MNMESGLMSERRNNLD